MSDSVKKKGMPGLYRLQCFCHLRSSPSFVALTHDADYPEAQSLKTHLWLSDTIPSVIQAICDLMSEKADIFKIRGQVLRMD